MMTLFRVALLLVGASAAPACDVHDRPSSIAPTAPTPPSLTPPAAPAPPTNVGSGTVAIRSIAPASGTTVGVSNCPPEGSGTFTTLCTDRVRATIDVQVESDIPSAALAVVFYDERQRPCGRAHIASRALTAGVPTTIEATRVFLSTETNEGIGSTPQLVQPCQLPATTTSLVVQVWRQDSPVTPALARQFAQRYTFTEP